MGKLEIKVKVADGNLQAIVQALARETYARLWLRALVTLAPLQTLPRFEQKPTALLVDVSNCDDDVARKRNAAAYQLWRLKPHGNYDQIIVQVSLELTRCLHWLASSN